MPMIVLMNVFPWDFFFSIMALEVAQTVLKMQSISLVQWRKQFFATWGNGSLPSLKALPLMTTGQMLKTVKAAALVPRKRQALIAVAKKVENVRKRVQKMWVSCYGCGVMLLWCWREVHNSSVS
jgi:hypothetical protein